MAIPRDLTTWTYDTVLEIVHSHEFEPAEFDYKPAIVATKSDPAKEELSPSIRKTACGMANADGGFILFGVKDRKYPVSSPDKRLEGMPLGADLRKQFGDKISDIQREVHFEAVPRPIVLPNDPTKGIFVVYIPSSARRPHMVVSDGVFYRRGAGGTSERMAFYEVREQMLYTEERLQKVTLFRLQLAQYRRLADRMHSQSVAVYNLPDRFDTSVFMALLADICGTSPRLQGLLARLADVPLRLAVINKLLDEGRTLPDNMKSLKADYLTGLALDFFYDCERFQNELEVIFGPLSS